MTSPRILVAGIGNIFLCDDAFGVEVVRLLEKRPLPDGVTMKDFGIRGFDLAYALLDDYDVSILVDATPRGGEPGTIYIIEADTDGDDANQEGAEDNQPHMDAHRMDPESVFRLVRRLDGHLRRVLVVGCEPATFDDESMELSAPVAAAVPVAAARIEALLNELRLAAPAGPGVAI